MTVAPKPVPVPDQLSAGFWAAAAEKRLVMQACGTCSSLAYPPGPVCRNCRADPPTWTWQEVSGRGRLKTWTVIRDSFLPGFAPDVPFVVADVELVEQPRLRMIARIHDLATDDVALDLALEVRFGPLEAGTRVPYFVTAVEA